MSENNDKEQQQPENDSNESVSGANTQEEKKEEKETKSTEARGLSDERNDGRNESKQKRPLRTTRSKDGVSSRLRKFESKEPATTTKKGSIYVPPKKTSKGITLKSTKTVKANDSVENQPSQPAVDEEKSSLQEDNTKSIDQTIHQPQPDNITTSPDVDNTGDDIIDGSVEPDETPPPASEEPESVQTNSVEASKNPPEVTEDDKSNSSTVLQNNRENEAEMETDQCEKQQLPSPSPKSSPNPNKRRVQVRGKSLDEELLKAEETINEQEGQEAPDIESNSDVSKEESLTENSPSDSQPSPPAPASNKQSIKIQSRSNKSNEEATEVPTPSTADTMNGSMGTDEGSLKESLNQHNISRAPSGSANSRKQSRSKLLDSLMSTYLDQDYVNRAATLQKPAKSDVESEPSSRKVSANVVEMDKLEENLQDIRERNRKQPPPPIRNKPLPGSRTWDNPKETQRPKVREKQWPPIEPPKDIGAYVVESYGQTDPYTKRLIKDIQRAKREEEERKQAEKRAEIISANTQPVDILRDVFTTKPSKAAPGKLKPQVNLNEEKSWIRHEKKPVAYDNAPEEPDWMKLIRNRRWKSTVKARFPCKASDKTEFDRRSTTPKNWKKLSKDKNAMKILGEIVGVGAEGEELFMRLASQRQKLGEDQDQDMDQFAAQELLAYQVARESLGEDAAYSLQMDNPLPAARMKPLQSTSTAKSASFYGSHESLPDLSQDALLNYPFTTSQLEAAYLSNQLLRLHPEEFRKLISLERSRQATLRWQFSSDPFDSVHEHQDLPYEMALLASEEPRIMQAMRKLVAQGGSDDYRSVFSSAAPTPQPRYRRRSEGAYNNYYTNYESDGYESSNSVSSSSSVGVVRGRPRKKKKPVPLPPQARPRGRSTSPGMMSQQPNKSYIKPPSRSVSRSSSLSRPDDRANHVGVTPSGKISPTPLQAYINPPSRKTSQSRDAEQNGVQAHSLFDDADLQLEDEIANMEQLTSNLSSNIDEELKGIETSVEDRKKGFFKEAIKSEHSRPRRPSVTEEFDTSEISSRRREMVEMEQRANTPSDVRADLPKTRHKVRRINSNAQLNAVFRKRRQMSEVDATEGQQTHSGNNQDDDTSKEISNVISDINQTYGD